MLNKIYVIVAVLLFTINSQANPIPVENFAAKSDFISMKISPDGKHMAFTFEQDSSINLGVMDMKTKKGIYSFEMGDNREVAFFHWGNNERLIIQSQRITGWLDGARQYPELFSADYDGKNREMLWDFQRSGVRLVSLLKEDKEHILITKHHYADNYSAKLQRMNIYTGKLNFVPDSPTKKGGLDSTFRYIAVDSDDVPRFALEYDPVEEENLDDDVSYLHVKNKNGDWQILTLEVKHKELPTVSGLGFNKANTKFYFTSNHDLDHNGSTGLFVLDYKDNSVTKLFRHPDVDIRGPLYGRDDQIIGVTYEAGYPGYYYIDDKDNQDDIKLHKQLRATFKGQEVGISSYTKNHDTATLYVYSDKNPGTHYLYNVKKQKIEFLANSKTGIDPEKMATVEPFTLEARDGLKMYGQMTIPPGKELKNLPLVIYPHGGPYGPYDRWQWDARAQLLASRGYLVIQLNFRGSGGYGEDFQEAGYGEWGTTMQDDLTDVTLWAVNKGYADKERLCIHGVSYGGYASLNAVVREPDLYKCSIPDAGLYEIELQWDKADSFKGRPKAKENFKKRSFGSTDKAVLDARSPALHADKIKAELLLVHGTEDVRVPIENAYFLEEQLEKAGKSYEKIYRKDGHGFQKVPYRIELYNKMLAFLDKHIGEKSQ
jgi:dipeptidyl aminopeptidase/acylaminoacyl peptidase